MALERIFETAEALLDDSVDHFLGDVVLVKNGVGEWTERKCFVLDEHGILNLASLDGIAYRIRIKLRTDYAPHAGLARFTGGKLGDRVWKPAGDVEEHIGKYTVYDLQLTPGAA